MPGNAKTPYQGIYRDSDIALIATPTNYDEETHSFNTDSVEKTIQNAIDEVCESNAGVAVLISATHTCACLRGVKHDGCAMMTSKLSGSFYDDEKTRAEFYHFVDSWNRSPSI